MKKLLTLLLVLVCSVSWGAGTTTEDKSGTNALYKNASFSERIQIGPNGTPMKSIIVASLTADAEGGQSEILTGIDNLLVVSWTINVRYGANAGGILPNETNLTGYQYSASLDSNGIITVTNHATNSENILGKQVEVLIWYR